MSSALPSGHSLTGLVSNVTFEEQVVNATPVRLDTDVTFTSTTNNFDGGKLTVSGLLAEDSVGISNVGTGAGQIGISGSNVLFGNVVIGTFTGGAAGASLVITFNASATATAIDALLENLTYANSSNTPTVTRNLMISVTDGAGVLIGNPIYTLETGAANPLNGVNTISSTAPTFVDLDKDGDIDAIVGKSDGTINYYKNTGTATAPILTLQTGVANPFNGIDLGDYSKPAFADLDRDGDMDAIVGKSDGTINYYKNTGTATAPVFTLQTGGASLFGSVDVGHDSTPAFADLDGDGDMDAVIGEAQGVLNYYENTGTFRPFAPPNTPPDPSFTLRIGANSPLDGPIVGLVTAPTFADLDKDGDLDAVVGKATGEVVYFLNTGTSTTPVFIEQTGAANPFNGIDVGDASTPSFADLDGDDDLDIFIGEYDFNINYYRNIGSAYMMTVNITAQNENPFTSGNDIVNLHALLGSSNYYLPDVTNALDGDDVVQLSHVMNVGLAFNAGAGNDVVAGGDGANRIDGGADNDTLSGGIRADTLTGGDGVDTVSYAGSAAAVTVTINGTASGGQAQGDVLSNFENLTGSSHGDTLTGDSNANIIDGRANSDSIDGGDGADTIIGGAGADTLIGGHGIDTINYAGSTAAVTVTINGATSGGDALGDVLSNFENLIGSNHADTLTGDGAANIIDGGANSDVVNGGDGADTIIGGTGADTLAGGDGIDTVSYATSTAAINVTINGAASGGDAAGDSLSSFENLIGSSYGDALTGDSMANRIDGGTGNDTLSGGVGADTLLGGDGNDDLTIDGQDVVTGGSGYDIARFSEGSGAGFDMRGTSIEELRWSVDGTDTVVILTDNGMTATTTDVSDNYNFGAYTTSYTDGWVAQSRSGTYDDGGLWSVVWDTGNTSNWRDVSTNYDAQGRVTSQVGTYDDGTLWSVSWDTGNTSNWRDVSTNYDSQNRVSAQLGTYDDGAKWYVIRDTNNVGSWRDVITTYDTQGRATSQAWTNDDGTSWSIVWDAGNSAGWREYVTVYDAQGRATSQSGTYDNGALWSVIWDVGNTGNWRDISTSYDAQGRALAQAVTYDDGSTWSGFF
jgi:hypothetical protein